MGCIIQIKVAKMALVNGLFHGYLGLKQNTIADTFAVAYYSWQMIFI